VLLPVPFVLRSLGIEPSLSVADDRCENRAQLSHLVGQGAQPVVLLQPGTA
jgi:hypothetical protein